MRRCGPAIAGGVHPAGNAQLGGYRSGNGSGVHTGANPDCDRYPYANARAGVGNAQLGGYDSGDSSNGNAGANPYCATDAYPNADIYPGTDAHSHADTIAVANSDSDSDLCAGAIAHTHAGTHPHYPYPRIRASTYTGADIYAGTDTNMGS